MRTIKKSNRKAQVSFEYLIIMGFVTFIIITILGIALFYGNSIKDRIRITQVNNFANKIISTSESVFYAGEPSKATINTYLPENIEEVLIDETDNALVISVRTSSGVTRTAFQSNVPITGILTTSAGLKKIEIKAEDQKVNINLA